MALAAVLWLVLLPGAFQSRFKTATAQNALPTLIFVAQPPFGKDFISTNAVFGNHQPRTGLAPRGGDLWLRYSDGTLRNLTQAAGYGTKAGAIAARLKTSA